MSEKETMEERATACVHNLMKEGYPVEEQDLVAFARSELQREREELINQANNFFFEHMDKKITLPLWHKFEVEVFDEVFK